MPDYLFVYGTLLPGRGPKALRPVLDRLRDVGPGTTCGRLYHLGRYPGCKLLEGDEVIAGRVLELPVSAALNRSVPAWMARAYGRAPMPYTTRRILRLTGIATVRWLRPSYSSAEEMISLARQITRRGVPLLNLLFHSSEAIAGTSPYTRNESERAGFFDRLSRALRFMLDTLEARPLTFAEFHREFGGTARHTSAGATD